ncbi:hypothetical protein T492DRAFT_59035 [Pavlovales sp. CCMP2436]|nr:hypothetical protein T492DRAFT_59035 [Pavlovales sp. CCMP2436]
MQMSVPQMRVAILGCNEVALTAEKLSALLKCVPSAEEIELVLSTIESELADGGAPPALGLAESFVKEVGAIPRLQERLESIHFKSRFAQELQALYADAMAVSVACDEARESEALQRLLGVVLRAGNMLNSGTFRGDAQGVKLECLTRLVELKSVQPGGAKSDLLSVCLHALAPQLPTATDGAVGAAAGVDTAAADHTRVRAEADALVLELGSARNAAKVCMTSLNEDVGLFEAGFKRVEEELRVGRAEGGTVDGGQFERAMGLFCGQAGTQVRGLRAELSRVEEEFAELRVYFGEDDGVSVSDFFARLSAFVSQLEAISARCASAASALGAKRQRTGGD